MVVVPPIPSASVSVAIAVNPGFRRSRRAAYVKSLQMPMSQCRTPQWQDAMEFLLLPAYGRAIHVFDRRPRWLKFRHVEDAPFALWGLYFEHERDIRDRSLKK